MHDDPPSAAQFEPPVMTSQRRHDSTQSLASSTNVDMSMLDDIPFLSPTASVPTGIFPSNRGRRPDSTESTNSGLGLAAAPASGKIGNSPLRNANTLSVASDAYGISVEPPTASNSPNPDSRSHSYINMDRSRTSHDADADPFNDRYSTTSDENINNRDSSLSMASDRTSRRVSVLEGIPFQLGISGIGLNRLSDFSVQGGKSERGYSVAYSEGGSEGNRMSDLSFIQPSGSGSGSGRAPPPPPIPTEYQLYQQTGGGVGGSTVVPGVKGHKAGLSVDTVRAEEQAGHAGDRASMDTLELSAELAARFEGLM